ncbi:MAG TPA: hypothetical protein VM433_01975 [Mycobacteriales bacterium]|nr:hypothetical protein [Mycobacteriales bacterium]
MDGACARTVELEVRAPLSHAEVDRLCEAVVRHVADDTVLVVCVLAGPVDVGVVDALARIGLLARRTGLTVRVRCDSGPLRPLLHLCGLDDVLPGGDEPTVVIPAEALSRRPPVCQSAARTPGGGPR